MKTVFLLTIAAIAAALLPGPWLELQRGGEPWRIVTCHFTHFTHEQLAWDGLVFIALGAACTFRNRRSFHATLLASVVIVPLTVLLFAPGIQTYRGLSGIDSALFALLLVSGRRSPVSWILAIAFFGKITFELLTDATLFVQNLGPGVVAVPVAHVAGAITGVACACIDRFATIRRWRDVVSTGLSGADSFSASSRSSATSRSSRDFRSRATSPGST